MAMTGAAALARWLIGGLADHHGAARFIAPMLGVGATGLAVIAVGIGGGGALVILGCALIGLVLGVGIGYLLHYNVPPEYARYVSVAVLAALDSALGRVRALLQRTFDDRLFITGFLSNTLLAAMLTFVGDRLGVSLYLAAVIAFGVRVFQNLAVIRRLIIR